MTHTHHLRLLLATGLLALSTTSVQAAPLTQWLSTGDVAQAPQLGFISFGSNAYLLGTASTNFTDDAPFAAGALNLSGNNAADISALTSTLGLAATAFDNETAFNYAYEGSALFSTLVVQAGDTLSFDWRLLGQISTGPVAVPDAAWLTLGADVVELGDISSLSNTTDGWLDSGSLHVSHTFLQAGSITVGFVVADIDSYDTTSVLAVQNLALTPAVPEPSSIALLLTSLGILGGVSARRRQT